MDSKQEKNTKDIILKTATKLFAQKGYSGTSLRDIAKVADVNVALIAYYWGNKKGLYQGIINGMIETQTKYATSALDFAINPDDLSKQEQVELMFKTIDRAIDFFYGEVSYELLTFLMHGQKEKSILGNLPLFKYGMKLFAALFNKEKIDKEVILTLVSIIALINSPRLMPNFSLMLMNQRTFHKDDIKIIRRNVHNYMKSLLREYKIEY